MREDKTKTLATLTHYKESAVRIEGIPHLLYRFFTSFSTSTEVIDLSFAVLCY